MQNGVIEIELAGTGAGQFDRVIVEGALIAGGTLSVNFNNGFAPALGDAFDILDFTSIVGSFSLDLPALSPGLVWDTSNLLTSGLLSVVPAHDVPADFNGDGSVDAADLALW